MNAGRAPPRCRPDLAPRPRLWRRAACLGAGLLLAVGSAVAAGILFIGNSFVNGQGSAVHYYRADTVADLNSQGAGGVAALFKSFTTEAGLDHDVYLETEPGVGLDWHLENRPGLLGQRPWDIVVLQGYSTLDANRPRDATALVKSVRQLADLLRGRNPGVGIYLMATWPRADQIHEPGGAWHGSSNETMSRDLRRGYDQAAAGTANVRGVAPVGEAWVRAMQTGIADANPYDGIDAGKLNLWSDDRHHASTSGYYLTALVLFGAVTGLDPRSLGNIECSGFELGLSTEQVAALQQVAYDQLAAEALVRTAPLKPGRTARPARCVRPR